MLNAGKQKSNVNSRTAVQLDCLFVQGCFRQTSFLSGKLATVRKQGVHDNIDTSLVSEHKGFEMNYQNQPEMGISALVVPVVTIISGGASSKPVKIESVYLSK